MKSITLKLHGEAFDPRPVQSNLLKVIAYLDKCPADEIFFTSDVSQKLGLHAQYLRDKVSHALVAPYTALIGRRRYVGSKAAIAELKRQTGAK